MYPEGVQSRPRAPSLNDCSFILTTGGRDARLDWLEAAVFERRKMYDIAVSMSRHPELNDYIHQV